jgi:hypothetical protein
MASITSTLSRIKLELSAFLPDEAILAACRDSGYAWRDRLFGPVQTIHLFILQLLNFNIAMTGLRHLSKMPVKAPAYCRARLRLPRKVLEALLVQSSAAMRQVAAPIGEITDGLWCGLVAYLVDGSSTIAPDTPSSQKAFGQPKGCKTGCGFPVPKIAGSVHSLTWRCFWHGRSKVFSAFIRSRSWTFVPIASTDASTPGGRSPRVGARARPCRTAGSSGGWASGIRWSSGSSQKANPSG